MRDDYGLEVTHALAVEEHKSLNAAPDSAFDALDAVDETQTVYLLRDSNSDSGLAISVESLPVIPKAGGRKLRPRPPTGKSPTPIVSTRRTLSHTASDFLPPSTGWA